MQLQCVGASLGCMKKNADYCQWQQISGGDNTIECKGY